MVLLPIKIRMSTLMGRDKHRARSISTRNVNMWILNRLMSFRINPNANITKQHRMNKIKDNFFQWNSFN